MENDFSMVNPYAKPLPADPHYYHAFRRNYIGLMQDWERIDCNKPDIQCVRGLPTDPKSYPTTLAFQHIKTLKRVALEKILNEQLDKSICDTVKQELFSNNAYLDRPYGYLLSSFEGLSWLKRDYVIVKTVSEEKPKLDGDKIEFPSLTTRPAFFNKKVSGGRRKTKSRSHKKRRLTRRKNRTNRRY